jgi:riboflavin kinase/FMN adenylyltransferase
MQVHRNFQDLPSFRRAVITIGTFDGVHAGHQHILHELIDQAKQCDGESVLITFDPHPREVLSPSIQKVRLLTNLDEKIHLLQRHGIDHVVVVPFTKAFAQLSAEAYLQDFLVETFHPHTILIGYDHHFGHNRTGDLALLKAHQDTYGYQVVEIPAQVVSELAVSSTKIRENLLEGKVQLARELLANPYFLQGFVKHGDKIGRTLGFPTANIEIHDTRKLIPRQGVYAVWVHLEGERFMGALNIGTRPTFDGTELRVEVYILDFDREIYGANLQVDFIAYIRPDKKFDSIDALVVQMHQDVAQVRAILELAD